MQVVPSIRDTPKSCRRNTTCIYYPLTLSRNIFKNAVGATSSLARPPSKLRLCTHQDTALIPAFTTSSTTSKFGLLTSVTHCQPFEPNLPFRPLLSPLVSVARGSMALSKIIFFAFLTLATSAMFSTMTRAVRQFNKRSDLDMVPPISDATSRRRIGRTRDSPNCPISSPQLHLHSQS